MSALSVSHRPPLGLGRSLRIGLGLVLAALYALPLVVMVMTSLKSRLDLVHNPVLSLPDPVTIGNYAEGWARIGQGVFNSMQITVPAVVFAVLLGCIAAFPLSHARLRGQNVIYVFLLIGLLVPQQVVQIPLFLMMRSLGLYDTIPGMWLVFTVYGLPFCTFFMRNFFASVPRSLYEAAQIDGCTPIGYFFKILLPTSLPGLAALAIVQSRIIWNDLFFGLTLTMSADVMPAPVGLYTLIGSMATETGPLMAATVISILPVLIVFLVFQKAFTRGLLGGTSK